MRVIAGQYRSRPLQAPRGMDVRPTSDRLRETLFNVLASAKTGDLTDTVWLDVFAGSGAVGIEAISRGARQVYFIENARPSNATIRANLTSLGIEEGFQIIERDAVLGLRLLDAEAIRCDICFLDPPYKLASAYEQTLGFLSQSAMIRPETIVIAEHDKHFDPGERFGSLLRFRKLEQGDANLSFYRLTP